MTGLALHKCNICAWEGEQYTKRDNSLVCPRCNSRQRHRSIYRYLTEHNLVTGKACLDIASRRIFRQKLQYANYVTIDKVQGRAEVVMDVCDLRFDSGCFDLIICCSVLQFVESYETALEELCRVLKPGGKCVIQIPYEHGSCTYIKEIPRNLRCQTVHEVVFFSYDSFLQSLSKRFKVDTFIYEDDRVVFSNKQIFVCSKPASLGKEVIC